MKETVRDALSSTLDEFSRDHLTANPKDPAAPKKKEPLLWDKPLYPPKRPIEPRGKRGVINGQGEMHKKIEEPSSDKE